MTDSFVGKSIGRYHIESEIGRGGMGVVYRGRQISLNRPVAIKVLPPQLALDQEFVQRFRQEAETIAGLAHEHIVHVYDIEEAAGAYFIVMELVDGQSLRALMERRRLSLDEVRVIGVALAQALAYAHARGIVHRDIKSPNVMITTEGKVKLMDFGIARVAGGAVRTKTGSVLGTPEYMAPEQARSGEISPQTDLYSLGVLLYEMAAGRLPFQGGDPFSVALKHVSEPPPPPRGIDPEVPEWLEAVILKAMAKDPADRYASAAEMARDLRTGSAPAAGVGGAPAAGVAGAGAAGAAAAGMAMAGMAAEAGPPATPATGMPAAAAGAPAATPTPATGAPAAAVSIPPATPATGVPAATGAPPPAAAEGSAAAAAASGTDLSRRARQAVAKLPPWVRRAALAAVLVLLLAAVLMALPRGERPPAEVPTAAAGGDQGATTMIAATPLSSGLAGGEESRPARPLVPLDEVLEEKPPPAPPPERRRQPAPPPAAGGESPAVTEPPRAEPAPVVPPPQPRREPAYSEVFRCREAVEFHVSPEDADVSVDGAYLGIADDWDGMGGGKEWRPGPGVYFASFSFEGHRGATVKIVVEAGADDKVCDVDTDLEEID